MIRDDYIHHVTQQWIDRDGRPRSVHIMGTREQIVERISEIIDSQLKWGETASITFIPIHPASVQDLTKR